MEIRYKGKQASSTARAFNQYVFLPVWTETYLRGDHSFLVFALLRVIKPSSITEHGNYNQSSMLNSSTVTSLILTQEETEAQTTSEWPRHAKTPHHPSLTSTGLARPADHHITRRMDSHTHSKGVFSHIKEIFLKRSLPYQLKRLYR